MGQSLEPKSLVPAAYVPTAPRTGSEGGFLYRMKNMILRGDSGRDFLSVYGGNKDLVENLSELAATGTATIVVGSLSVAGIGSAFRAELRGGQHILVIGVSAMLATIDEVLSDTSLTLASIPTMSAVGTPLRRVPVIFEVNKKRGSLITGNAIQFDKGTIIAAGTGVLRFNGSALLGVTSVIRGSTGAPTPWTVAKKPSIAIYDPNADTLTWWPLGMASPVAGFTAAALAGGVKNMQAGIYSLFICPARQATNGYNNPSLKAEVTIATGDQVRLTIPARDGANGQDAWRIYASTFTEQGGVNGPWYFVKQITTPGNVAAAGGTYDLEWNDFEISGNERLTFDNDAPVDCEFVATVNGYPVYVSCQGQGYSTGVPTTSPGPFIIPAKPNNIEAAPLKYAVSPSPPETIIGCISAQGRLYLMTANTLQVAEFISFPINDPNIPPLTIRPFWRAGFKHPNQLCFVDGTLYGYTTQGPTRSISYGDEGSEEHKFAAAVKEITDTWSPAKVFVGHDPVNNAVCFIHSSDPEVSSEAGVASRVLMFGLERQAWIGDIVLAANRDMIVTGVATVNGRLEFIAGGRDGGPIVFRTHHFDARKNLDGGAGTIVPWYLAWQFTDDGSEMRDKTVKAIRVTGLLTASATAGIHGAGAGEIINVPALEAGNSGSKSGSIPLVATTSVGQGARIPTSVPNLGVWTVRVDDTWGGSVAASGLESRVDEVVVERSVGGVRR